MPAACVPILLATGDALPHSPEMSGAADVMCVYRKNPNSLEGKFRDKPLEKASRDISDYKIYLKVVNDPFNSLILKKLVWCYFYRIFKSIQLLAIRHLFTDFFFFIRYTSFLLFTRFKTIGKVILNL